MSETKMFNVKLPKELWLFVKNKAAIEGKPMAYIIEKAIEKMKKRSDKKKLTRGDTDV